MAKKDCTNCAYSKWPLTATGRRSLSRGNGECLVVVDIPLCYSSYRGELPLRNGISPYTCKFKECSLWKSAGKNPKVESPVNIA